MFFAPACIHAPDEYDDEASIFDDPDEDWSYFECEDFRFYYCFPFLFTSTERVRYDEGSNVDDPGRGWSYYEYRDLRCCFYFPFLFSHVEQVPYDEASIFDDPGWSYFEYRGSRCCFYSPFIFSRVERVRRNKGSSFDDPNEDWLRSSANIGSFVAVSPLPSPYTQNNYNMATSQTLTALKQKLLCPRVGGLKYARFSLRKRSPCPKWEG